MNDIFQKSVLTFAEALLYLGLSRSTLYKMTSGGMIPFYKPNGKKLYFDRLELEAWLKRNRNASQSELEDQAISWVNRKK